MSLFEDTNPRALKDLLVEVHSRTMVLPDFQRDFVWEPGATQELNVSIANNYPTGIHLPSDMPPPLIVILRPREGSVPSQTPLN